MLSWKFAVPLTLPIAVVSSWGAANVSGICVPELRRLSAGEYISSAVEWRETGQTSVTRADGQVRAVEKPASAEEYLSLYPGCCSVVTGPGADAFEEPDLWDKWFDNFSTIVRIRSPQYHDVDGTVLLKAREYYVPVNNCAVVWDL
jgi:hypothetical protein